MIDWNLVIDLAAAGGTTGALLLAVWQLRQNARLAAEAAAIATWMEYLRLGLANPDLGETSVALKQLKLPDAAALLSGETPGSQRYLWFLTILLDACDNLIRRFGSPTWIITVEHNLDLHREALAACWSRVGPYYSTGLGEAVTRVLNGERAAERGL